MSPDRRRDLRLVHPTAPPESRVVVPNAVLGTMIFILTEIMLFAGLISAHAVARTNFALWPPFGDPRLPVEATAVNSLVLLASGALLFAAGRRFAAGDARARWWMAASIGLGAFFVLFQGIEWVQLIAVGLTLTKSTHSAFFYLIVGAHALHCLAGLTVLVVLFNRWSGGRLGPDAFWAGRLYWYFVVLLWPILYWQVYL